MPLRIIFYPMFKESMLVIGDNSGPRRAKLIGILGSFYKKQAFLGDFVIVAIQHRRWTYRFVNTNIYLANIVTRRKNIARKQGFFVKFHSNKIILLSENGKVVGTRVNGPIAKEIQKLNILKLLSLAKAML